MNQTHLSFRRKKREKKEKKEGGVPCFVSRHHNNYLHSFSGNSRNVIKIALCKLDSWGEGVMGEYM